MKNKLLGYLYVLIATSAWGSNYVVSKFVLGRIPPFTLLFLRYVVAAVILLMVLMKDRRVKIERKDYKYIFFIGFVGYFLGVGSQLLGTQLSNASLASLINAMNPIFIILFAMPILKEKITVNKVISIIAAVFGTYIIIGGVNNGGMVIGIIICIFATLTWAFMSVVSKRVTQKYNALTVTTYSIIISICFTLPASLVELVRTPNVRLFEPTIIWSVLYMGSICTALAYVLWNKSLSMMEAGICSLFYPVQPMVSVLLGWMLLGEQMNASFFAGAILIIGGVIFSILANQEEQSSKERICNQ